MENKKLDLHLIEEANKKYDMKTVSIPVELNGEMQNAELKIYKKFPPTIVAKCLEEFVQKMSFVMEKNRGYFQEIYEPYLMFMIIKHFSDFPAPTEYEKQIKVIRMMIDNDLLYKIFCEFDPNEISKLSNVLEETAKQLDENAEGYYKYLIENGIEEELVKNKLELEAHKNKSQELVIKNE